MSSGSVRHDLANATLSDRRCRGAAGQRQILMLTAHRLAPPALRMPTVASGHGVGNARFRLDGDHRLRFAASESSPSEPAGFAVKG